MLRSPGSRFFRGGVPHFGTAFVRSINVTVSGPRRGGRVAAPPRRKGARGRQPFGRSSPAHTHHPAAPAASTETLMAGKPHCAVRMAGPCGPSFEPCDAATAADVDTPNGAAVPQSPYQLQLSAAPPRACRDRDRLRPASSPGAGCAISASRLPWPGPPLGELRVDCG